MSSVPASPVPASPTPPGAGGKCSIPMELTPLPLQPPALSLLYPMEPRLPPSSELPSLTIPPQAHPQVSPQSPRMVPRDGLLQSFSRLQPTLKPPPPLHRHRAASQELRLVLLPGTLETSRPRHGSTGDSIGRMLGGRALTHSEPLPRVLLITWRPSIHSPLTLIVQPL